MPKTDGHYMHLSNEPKLEDMLNLIVPKVKSTIVTLVYMFIFLRICL